MIRSLAKAMLRKKGLQLVREPDLAMFLAVHQVDLVLDIGANVGQFAQGLRRSGYHGRIHSFEPIGDVFDQLAQASSGDPLWSATRSAVGATPGEVAINVSALSVLSSIKPGTPAAAAFDARSAVIRTETVPVTTIADILSQDAGGAVFLKVDTQGYEEEVLAGARPVSDRIVGLQLELPISHLYADVWSFEEAVASVRSLGFTPAQFRTVNTVPGDPASALEFDCVFRRIDPPTNA
jgi:FkbM family methyltransferase